MNASLFFGNPMLFRYILCFFSVLFAVLGGTAVELSKLRGVIVLFETDNEITDEIIKLKEQYKDFVKTELENSIGFDYNTLFVGFSVKFTNLAAIYYKVSDYLGVEEVAQNSDQVIYDGLYDMLVNYKAKDLQRLGVVLSMLPDAEVGIYRDDGIDL